MVTVVSPRMTMGGLKTTEINCLVFYKAGPCFGWLWLCFLIRVLDKISELRLSSSGHPQLAAPCCP